MGEDEQAVMCVLMLRGPQTPGELKQRAERMHRFADLEEVQETLARLIERELVARHERRPGQKEERYAQLLQDPDAPDAGAARHRSGARSRRRSCAWRRSAGRRVQPRLGRRRACRRRGCRARRSCASAWRAGERAGRAARGAGPVGGRGEWP